MATLAALSLKDLGTLAAWQQYINIGKFSYRLILKTGRIRLSWLTNRATRK
jgi:hypothetical protein